MGLKQMKVVHQVGFSVEERVAYQVAIYQNLLESARRGVHHERTIYQACGSSNPGMARFCPSACAH